MNILKLKDDFYWIGVQDRELKVFDIIMETEYGTTYNSYLLKTDSGVVLFETVKVKFFDQYIEKVKELTSIEDIKYIVCSHTEPDHSGSVQRLLEMNPNISVVSSFAANRNLNEIVNGNFNSMIVKDNEELKVGNKILRFLSVPNLHWPDTIYTYIVEDKTLVTCDSFGAHYASDKMLLSNVKDRTNYEDAFQYYTTMIMGPFKPFIKKALEKIKPLDIDLIAPGHGLIIDTEIDHAIQKYADFAQEAKNERVKVVIPYVTAYGYTKEIAEIVCEEVRANNMDCEMYDLVVTDNDMVFDEMVKADAILYGSCTILADALPPIYNIMNRMISGYHGVKKVSAFGSYGWSGEAVPNLLVRLKQQRMKVVDDGYRVLFKPSDAQREEIRAYARNFISKI